EKNIKFAIASGRQYYNLLKNFDDIKDDLFYIADNGSNIYYKGEPIYIETIDKEEVIKILKDIRGVKDMYPVISGVESAYIENKNHIFIEEVKRYYEKLEIVDDLLDVIEREKICKFAVYDMIDSEKYAYNILKKYDDKLLVCISGKHWLDIMSPKVNKGEAIKILQEKYGISYDETMAFGDYLNDYEMMQSCKYSYAMDNAHPKLKEICNYRAKSNDEDGVVDAIKRHFQL
ncbi:HAD family hydrolase, partial [Terrisporobacter sp.]|uniref:HAD family hydrolase n=1 Tax=Terrisporobacter sp. TaxID=1965305 RepID=UPI0026361AEF